MSRKGLNFHYFNMKLKMKETYICEKYKALHIIQRLIKFDLYLLVSIY